jgi:hypothetical protein
MRRTRNGRKRITRMLAGIVISCALIAAAYACYAQTAEDRATSAKAFVAASQVFFHPRCVNCHPAGDAPLQGDEGRPHTMMVKRGPGGTGKNAMHCSNCHQATNLSGAHMPPGAPGWELPPEDMPMIFEKRTARQLCLQLKDPARNGNRTPKEVVEHVRTTPVVLWGWDPGAGRTPVPMSHETFMKNMTEWLDLGAACPE